MVMSTQSKIQNILRDLSMAENDLNALITQLNDEGVLPSQQINGLLGMQDTLNCYKQHLVELQGGQALNLDLIAIIETFTQRLKNLSTR